ncbi:hypothetical protein TWF281_008051 [Arthrobotrys megalospora]
MEINQNLPGSTIHCLVSPMAQPKGIKNKGGRQFWRHRRWQPKEAQQAGCVADQQPQCTTENQLPCAPTAAPPGGGGRRQGRNRRQRTRENHRNDSPLVPKVPKNSPRGGADGPIEPQGPEEAQKGFWDDDETLPAVTAGGSSRRVEGVVEAERYIRRGRGQKGPSGRQLQWEQIGERRRSAFSPPKEDVHSLQPHHHQQEDVHSLPSFTQEDVHSLPPATLEDVHSLPPDHQTMEGTPVAGDNQLVKRADKKEVARKTLVPSGAKSESTRRVSRDKLKRDKLDTRKREKVMLPGNWDDLDISAEGARMQASQYLGDLKHPQKVMQCHGMEVVLYQGQQGSEEVSEEDSLEEDTKNDETVSDEQAQIQTEVTHSEPEPEVADEVAFCPKEYEHENPINEVSNIKSFESQKVQPKPQIPIFEKTKVKKENVDPVLQEFMRNFFSDTRTKPRDESMINPAFQTKGRVPLGKSGKAVVYEFKDSSDEDEVNYGRSTIKQSPPKENVGQFVPYKEAQAQAQAQDSARGLNPFAQPFIPSQFASVAPPPLLSAQRYERPRYAEYDRKPEVGMIGHPAYLRQKQVVDKSLYTHSPFAYNFVASTTTQDHTSDIGQVKKVGAEIWDKGHSPKIFEKKNTDLTENIDFRSWTLYILHHAYDVGADYEDVHDVYDRRYGGEEGNAMAASWAIMDDAQYLLDGKDEGEHKAVGGIGGYGVGKNGKLTEDMKKVLREYMAKANELQYRNRTKTEISRALLKQPRWKTLQKRDKRLAWAESCTKFTASQMENGLASLEATGRYKKNPEKVKGVQGLYKHLKGVKERLETFKKETRKILDEMTRERAVVSVMLSGEATGSKMEIIREEEDDDADLVVFKGKGGKGGLDIGKLEKEKARLKLEAVIEAAMKSPAALCLGYVDSDEDDGGVKLSPEEAISYW